MPEKQVVRTGKLITHSGVFGRRAGAEYRGLWRGTTGPFRMPYGGGPGNRKPDGLRSSRLPIRIPPVSLQRQIPPAPPYHFRYVEAQQTSQGQLELQRLV